MVMHPDPRACAVAERNQVLVLATAMAAGAGVGDGRPIGFDLLVDHALDDLGGIELEKAREQQQPRHGPFQPMLAAAPY